MSCNDDGDSESSEPPLVFQVAEEFRSKKIGVGETIELSEDHVKILFLISLFARPAIDWDDEEGWIRTMPLLVYMYEGIVAGVFKAPDYAPTCIMVSQDGVTRRVWMNISQEGKAFVDDMREILLLNGLKLVTEDGQPVTSFQCSNFGLSVVEQMSQEAKDSVLELIYPTGLEGGPRTIKFDSEEGVFHMTTAGGFNAVSEISECEDVSYVSSPYLPGCLRKTNRPNTSNAHRAHEVAGAENNNAAETSEAVTLKNVHAMIAEWIPFGANQIVALNERLGALDRNQGGFFTNTVDHDPTSTQFDVPPGLTSVRILDFDFVRFTNFEAEINYPNDDGIIQIEEFGMHLDMDGTIVYGMFIEAIADRTAESLSVDDLSRVMVDIHQDSSEIMNDIISQHQKDLMNTVFLGDADNRPKFNLLMCDAIYPALSGKFFMDRSEREYEIKQVVGDVVHGTLVGDTDTLILGREGIVYAGPNAVAADALLIATIFICGKEQFLRAYFIRMFILNNEINNTRDLISRYLEDPVNVSRFREQLTESSTTIIQMTELLGYLEESIEYTKLPERPMDGNLMLAYDALHIEHSYRDLKLRVHDLRKLVDGSNGKLSILRQQGTSVNRRLLDTVVQGMDINFQGLVAATASDARAANANEIMNIIFAGGLFFKLIERFDGDGILGYNGVDTGTPELGTRWILDVFRPVYSMPGGFFALNITFFLVCSYLLRNAMQKLVDATLNARTLRKTMFIKVNVAPMLAYVKSKTLISTGMDASTDGISWKATWQDHDHDSKLHWGGDPPAIVCEVDLASGFLLQVNLQWNYRLLKQEPPEVVGRLLDEMEYCGAIDKMDDESRKELAVATAIPWMPRYGTDHVDQDSYEWRKSLKAGDNVVFDSIGRSESKILSAKGNDLIVRPNGEDHGYHVNRYSQRIVPHVDFVHPEKPLSEAQIKMYSEWPYTIKEGDMVMMDLGGEPHFSKVVKRDGTHLVIIPVDEGHGYHMDIDSPFDMARVKPAEDAQIFDEVGAPVSLVSKVSMLLAAHNNQGEYVSHARRQSSMDIHRQLSGIANY
jgi:hypothetical protein